jgi:hypothetical protein
VLGKVEILRIDELNFGEWVEAEVAVDEVRCQRFQFTRRQWNKIKNNETQLFTFLYQFGKSMNEKMGTYGNPLAIEEAA